MTPWQIVGAVALPNAGGILAAFYTRDAVRAKPGQTAWYDTLKRPNWRPPNWVFAPMWTGLYTSMGYASYLVVKETGAICTKESWPLALYGGQLALNWAWSPLFFKLHKIDWALYDIVALTVAATATGVAFYQVDKTAGYLFVPYVAWLSLATALNYCIWRDNPKVKITEIKDEKTK